MTHDIAAAESALREIADACRRVGDGEIGAAAGSVSSPHEEYGPLHGYVVTHFQQRLRRDLIKIQYPSIPSEVWEASDEDDDVSARSQGKTSSILLSIRSTARKLHEIAVLHEEVTCCNLSVQGSKASKQIRDPLLDHPVLQELCRPIVERVRFHFVSQTVQHSQPLSSSATPTTLTRIDRLPEWLLGYMREHVFQPYGPWEWIIYNGVLPERVGTASAAAATVDDFVNEMIRLIQWVLAERNFFRDPLVCGPSSQPMVLCRAVEQLLQFDAFIQSELVPPATKKAVTLSLPRQRRFVSLVDVCVAGDDELFTWWLHRERESAVATLLDNEAIVAHQTTWTGRVSPRAELFCSLIQSLRNKAAVFTFSAPYITKVASPLCMRFLDELHETATDLTRQLTGKQQSLSFSRNQLPTNSEWATLLTDWIEMINGAHMAAQTLAMGASTDAQSPVDEDMARFGRSLERLKGVMIDDFVTSTIEVLLMERAKFAGYLMRCSHLLASASEDYMVGGINIAKLSDLSPDLLETHRIVAEILSSCDEIDDLPVDHVENFAPRVMRERVLSMIAEKLLEVALDLQGMTPDLQRPGCVLFARDVIALFGVSRSLPNHALRVLDVVHLMRMESAQLGAIGGALCGLAGLPAPLTEADFEGDDKLFEEAVSMIRAKGLTYIELADVFAVLNRRRDLR